MNHVCKVSLCPRFWSSSVPSLSQIARHRCGRWASGPPVAAIGAGGQQVAHLRCAIWDCVLGERFFFWWKLERYNFFLKKTLPPPPWLSNGHCLSFNVIYKSTHEKCLMLQLHRRCGTGWVSLAGLRWSMHSGMPVMNKSAHTPTSAWASHVSGQ